MITRIPPAGDLRLSELALKSHERLFSERVPLPPEVRGSVELSDEWRYAALAEGVDAWGFASCRTGANCAAASTSPRPGIARSTGRSSSACARPSSQPSAMDEDTLVHQLRGEPGAPLRRT